MKCETIGNISCMGFMS